MSITVDQIMHIVSHEYKTPMQLIISKSRKREHVIPRQVYAYFCRTSTRSSLNEIGNPINRDHATIMHSVREVEGKLTVRGEDELKLKIQKIQEKINDLKINNESLEGLIPSYIDLIQLCK